MQAPIAALHCGRLVCLAPAAPGGSRLDAAHSIDLLAARDSVCFLARMRPEVASAAKELEAWVFHQQHGLDLAAGGGEMSTEKLLKVRERRGMGWAGCLKRAMPVGGAHQWAGESAATIYAPHRTAPAV